MVDAVDSKSTVERRAGSSPASGTHIAKLLILNVKINSLAIYIKNNYIIKSVC